MTRRNYKGITCAFLIALASSSLITTSTASDNSLIDLSEMFYEYAESFNEGPENTALLDLASREDDVNGMLALDNGKIVAEYSDVDFELDERYALFSGTKSWTSLLFGIMERDGVINVKETLWDIWPDSAIWSKVKDAEVRKQITIEDIMQMRAGLVMPRKWFINDLCSIRGGKLGGKDFIDSLTYHDIDPDKVGSYSYVLAGNILSYVILERTGQTPQDFAAERVFSPLGISETEYRWYKNRDGIANALHGLHMTITAYSKLGMLYLQGGMVNANEHLINQSWIDRTFTVGDTEAKVPYGYLWWIDGPSIYCSKGLGGQCMCINTETQRVMVVAGENYDEKLTELWEGDDAAPQIQLVEMFLGA